MKGVKRPNDGFFLRAESFYNMATNIDDIDACSSYGGVSLHSQSHGESFLSVIRNRFSGNGLYILDEPESAFLMPNVVNLHNVGLITIDKTRKVQ